MANESLVTAFIEAVQSGALKKLSMPNIPLQTMGGKVFWNELAESDGWRLQKNMVTGHCRILDPEDVRRAWGGDDAMMELFGKIKKA